MAPDGYPARSLWFAVLFLSRARDPFRSHFDSPSQQPVLCDFLFQLKIVISHYLSE